MANCFVCGEQLEWFLDRGGWVAKHQGEGPGHERKHFAVPQDAAQYAAAIGASREA